jgi:hypothetical protein
MNRVYSIALGSIYQAGSWDHDINDSTPWVPAFFKTTDEGVTWQRNYLTTTPGEIKALAVQPSNKNIMYAGGYTTITSNQYSFALFKTTNGGTDWTPLTVPSIDTYEQINAILIDPSNNNRIFLGTNRGVFVSTNAGSNWQSPVEWMYVLCLAPDPKVANKLYAGTNGSGVYETTNGGTNWSELNTGLTSKYIQCMDIDPVNNVLYVGTNGGGVRRMTLVTGVEYKPPSTEEPTQFVLHQNFPNPFNASTEIRYELNKTEKVQLSVLDIQGRLIRVLVDGIQSSGMNKTVWDGKDGFGREGPSGIYLFRLSAKDRIEIKKMVCQK